MSTATERGRATGGASGVVLLRRGVAALALSLVISWLITFGAISAAVAPELNALQYGSVTFLTTVGVVGATLVYGVLARVSSNPDRLFTIVAAVVLVLSLIPDVTVIPNQPGGNLAAGGILGAMHVTTAVVCVVVLTGVRVRTATD
ncbi:MAG: DUF6069 family protein [Natronomonas sp.]|jgi:hypothetical protein|uniref:DUF6069 family protein n=1 Tax=Natronomonas sp. TaxID=2184060 RepID=UPI00286FB6CE|nr:DUF6069 family protein [Natronomonas sp.]MDR9381052.1 DUF6069 family protein [Natronomonas sp.]MDR9430887.1 DUF6069 family protein [Natronomonas sp.]